MSTYQYTQLQSGEFRLLKLSPGDGNTELVGALEIYTLYPLAYPPENNRSPDPKPYDALSYTWEDDEIGHSIGLLRESIAYPVPIRPNLKAALLQLRDPKEPRYLWVDALCINQRDNKEKSEQIPWMFHIFSRARSVCVWLGREEGDGGRAMDFIRRLISISDDFDHLVADHNLSKDYVALSNLLKRPWFSRRWIVQEIALAKSATLHCGKESISWEDFADAVSLFVNAQPKIQTVFRNSHEFHNDPDYLGDLAEYAGARLVQVADDIFRKTEDGRIMVRLLSLEELMSTLSGFVTTDPRDVLYAILSLARDARPGLKDAFISQVGDGLEQQGNHSSNGPPVSPISPMSYVQNEQWSGLTPAMALRGGGQAPRSRASSDARSDNLSTVSAPGPAGLAVPVRGRGRAYSDAESIGTAAERQHNQQSGSDQGQIPVVVHPAADVNGGGVVVPNDADSHDTAEYTPGGERVNGQDINSPPPRRPQLSIDPVYNELAKKFIRTLRQQTILHRIPVDYDKNIVEVCRDVLFFTVSTSGSLNMLCRPWAPADESLPSWIAPISRNPFGLGKNGVYHRVNADPLVGQPGPGRSFYNAAKTTPAMVKPNPKIMTSLVAYGFVLGAVKEKKLPALAGVIPAEWNEVVGWKDTSKPPPEGFWRTLVGNRDSSGRLPTRLWKNACQKAFELRPKGGDLVVKEVITYKSPEFVKKYLERVLQTVWSRRLAFLENSRGKRTLCLAPREAKKGDKVCILYGCSVPVLLRECREERQAMITANHDGETNPSASARRTSAVEARVTYKVIGECYVHGMMDGEAITYQQQKKIEHQHFDLR